MPDESSIGRRDRARKMAKGSKPTVTPKQELDTLKRNLGLKNCRTPPDVAFAIRVDTMDSSQTWWVVPSGAVSTWRHRALYDSRIQVGLVADKMRYDGRRVTIVRIRRRVK